MGINLDWNVEADGGDWRPIREDSQIVAARRKRQQQLRRRLIAALVTLVLLAGAAGIRLATVAHKLREQLIATTAAETAALRIGDRNAFLRIQANYPDWRKQQSATFAAYQSWAGRLDITGQIVTLDLDADVGIVTLLETLDGQPYHVRWFYRRDESGWRHIPPVSSTWGETAQRETAHYDLEYRAGDAALAETLAPLLDGWWETACSLTGCAQVPRRARVLITTDPSAQTGWAAYDPTVLLVRSPLLDRVPAGRPYDPALVVQVREQIARQWAAALVHDAASPAHLNWLHNELTGWLDASFEGRQTAASPLADLSQAGPGTVLIFVEEVKIGTPPEIALATLGSAPASLKESTLALLTYRLRAMASLDASQQGIDAAYADVERVRAGLGGRFNVVGAAIPESIQVIGTHRSGEVLWAETLFQARPGGSLRPGPAAWISYEVFRQVDGRWVYSLPTLDDWGPPLTERTPHITLQYYTLDAPAADGLLDYLDRTYLQAAADLGVAPRRLPLIVTLMSANGLTHSAELSGGDGFRRPVSASRVYPLYLPSPHSRPRPATRTPAMYARLVAAPELVRQVVLVQAGRIDQDHPLLAAAMAWEMVHLGYNTQAELGWTFDHPALTVPVDEGELKAPRSLDDLWPESGDQVDYTLADYVAARALFDLLAERYGPGAVTSLMTNLADASSMDGWLLDSLDIRAGDIGAEWRWRVRRALDDLR